MAHDVRKNEWWKDIHSNDSDEIKSAEFYRNEMYIKIQKKIKESFDNDKPSTEIYLGQSPIGPGLTKYLQHKGFTIRKSKGSYSTYYYLQL